MKSYAHAAGFDDAPFERAHRGDVPVVGAVYAGARLDGVLAGRVRRDGANATRVLAELVQRSRFRAHLQVVMLQGIALAGFNVVDIHALGEALRLPIVVVSRRRPNLAAIRSALLDHVPGGRRKWTLIERAGPMEPIGSLWVQRVGLTAAEAAAVIRRFTLHSTVPEPLRTAHVIAGALGARETRQRV